MFSLYIATVETTILSKDYTVVLSLKTKKQSDLPISAKHICLQYCVVASYIHRSMVVACCITACFAN